MTPYIYAYSPKMSKFLLLEKNKKIFLLLMNHDGCHGNLPTQARFLAPAEMAAAVIFPGACSQ
jgi:hypothetical protein